MTVTRGQAGLAGRGGLRGSPAGRRLKAGDIIVGVNGKSLEGKTSDQATALIKGPAGSTVTLGSRTAAS